MSANVVVISSKDNVATATRVIKSGERLDGPGVKDISARGDIPYAHKVALAGISKGGRVIKYGESIGFATEAIRPGDYVHVHNLKTEEG